jgi:large subunit ribosomal protein L37Ae
MATEKVAAAGKRFGVRYGRSIRYKFSKIEAEQKKGHKCPYCHEPKVGRLAVGIWQCSKCKSKFTGRAYTIPKKVIIKEEAPQEEIIAGIEEDKAEEKEEEKPQKYKEKKVEEPKEQ